MSQRFNDYNDPLLIESIRNDKVGVLLTDTVYGLVASARSRVAIEKLYSIKARESSPGTIIGANLADFAGLGLDIGLLEQFKRFWPAPLSVVLDASGVASYLRETRDSLPVRVPDVPGLLELLQQVGPLMTTSANAHGASTSLSIDDAIDYFGERVDFYVDGGIATSTTPSTIVGVDATHKVTVFRAGAFPITRLSA